MDRQDLSNTPPSPSRTSEMIAAADRNLAASVAQLQAIRTYRRSRGSLDPAFWTSTISPAHFRPCLSRSSRPLTMPGRPSRPSQRSDSEP